MFWQPVHFLKKHLMSAAKLNLLHNVLTLRLVPWVRRLPLRRWNPLLCFSRRLHGSPFSWLLLLLHTNTYLKLDYTQLLSGKTHHKTFQLNSSPDRFNSYFPTVMWRSHHVESTENSVLLYDSRLRSSYLSHNKKVSE